MATQELLKKEELAARLKLKPCTITTWRRRGVIPFIQLNATTYRFDLDEVLAALRSRGPVAAIGATKGGAQGN